MNTEIEIKTALYRILQDAPIETVIRCLGGVCHDIEKHRKRSKKSDSGMWAMFGDKLTKLAD
ncbi:MAG: hypothetical protein KAS32_07660 [Candidatus Peribacteraceae bacterium]|nr:hypothetical protein [Candidatus Peribacteraceae bacterium]